MPPQSHSRKLPTSSKLVNEALIALDSFKGITLMRLYSYISETYSMTISKQRKVLIKKHITSLREAEDIINTTGRGLVGHFKLVDKKRFIRRLIAAERSATKRKNDPSHTGNLTARAEAPVELQARNTKGVSTKRNGIIIASDETSGLGGKTKRVTTKRKRHEDKVEEPTTRTVTEVPAFPPRRIKQPNMEPQVLPNSQVLSLHTQSVVQQVPYPPERTNNPIKRRKRINQEPRIVGLETQLPSKSQGFAGKQHVPLRIGQMNVNPQTCSPENLMFPVSQEYPFGSQEATESQAIFLHPQANTQYTSSSARTVHAAVRIVETNVILIGTQLTAQSQELSSSPATADRQRTSTVVTPVSSHRNSETPRSVSDEETECAPQLDTPMVSSSVHASTPIPHCSILLAPRRIRSNNLTSRDFTASLSIDEGTPRSSLTKKRRIDP